MEEFLCLVFSRFNFSFLLSPSSLSSFLFLFIFFFNFYFSLPPSFLSFFWLCNFLSSSSGWFEIYSLKTNKNDLELLIFLCPTPEYMTHTLSSFCCAKHQIHAYEFVKTQPTDPLLWFWYPIFLPKITLLQGTGPQILQSFSCFHMTLNARWGIISY